MFLAVKCFCLFFGQADEVRGDRVPRLARTKHTAPEHHLEPSRHDEQLLVPLHGAQGWSDVQLLIYYGFNVREFLILTASRNWEAFRNGCDTDGDLRKKNVHR